MNHLGDGSIAPSPGGLYLDGSLVPLGSTAAHEPTEIVRDLWARRKSLDATKNLYKIIWNEHLGTNGLPMNIEIVKSLL